MASPAATPGVTGGAALVEVLVPVVSAALTYTPWGAGGWLLGWALTEDTGMAPAVVRFLDGPAAGGALMVKLPLVANGTSLVRPGTGGWPISSSLTLAIDSGAISGSLVIGVAA